MKTRIQKSWRQKSTRAFLLLFLSPFWIICLQNQAWPGKEMRQGKLDLINPLLECAEDESVFKYLLPFRSKIEKYIVKEKSDGKASDISVYFRDLNNGPWFGIDEDKAFAPASLIKVPLMMVYLNQAQFNPKMLQSKLAYETYQGQYEMQVYKPPRVLTLGESYTIDDLILRMIAYSDNEAALLLRQNMDTTVLNETFRDFGIPAFDEKNVADSMSIRDLTSFFRVLYNASYLGKEMSNRALRILAQADFKNGIVAGVPSGITVAHKFGEREIVYEDGREPETQLHDCGIVYHPRKPYLLGVMTRGKSLEDLGVIIQGISRIVYEEIDRQMKMK